MARMLVVWCPDWPVVAAAAPPDSLTAVVHANRVVACSAAARAEGVRPGLRRREAQGRCPELELLDHDPARDARAFEPVLVAVERLTPWVEVLVAGRGAATRERRALLWLQSRDGTITPAGAPGGTGDPRVGPEGPAGLALAGEGDAPAGEGRPPGPPELPLADAG